MRRLASWLAVRGVSPNGISIAGMVAACVGGAALAATAGFPAWDRALYLVGAAGMQARLLANLLDGMVAVEGGRRSARGELFNEVPDRVSDCALLLGAGYAAGSSSTLGWGAACLALMVTYVRVLGKACGLGYDFRGPMAKQHRMAVLTLTCVYLALAPRAWRPSLPAMDVPSPGLMWAALCVICVGCVVTFWRRLMWVARGMKASA